MPIADIHRDEVFRYLTMLRRGFRELADVAGRPGVPMGPQGHVEVPEGTHTLFVSVGAPLPGMSVDLVVRDGDGGVRERVTVDSGETWLCIDACGATVFEFTVDHTVPGTSLGMPDAAPVGLLLWDLDILDSTVEEEADLGVGDGRSLTVRLDLVNKCNLKCRMCVLSLPDVFNQPRRELTVEQFRALGPTLLSRTRQLALSQTYEPMLHPELGEMVAVAREFGVPWIEMTSNATLITEALAEGLVDAGVDFVTFSIDGARAETYEYIRRGARFERFIEGLDTLARVKEKRGSAAPTISFNMVLMRRNVDELPDVVRLAHRYGAAVMHTSLLLPQDGLEMEEEALQHDRERANEVFASARAVADDLGVTLQLPDAFDLDLPDEPVGPRADTPPSGERLATPAPYTRLAPIPGQESLSEPLRPKRVGVAGGATMIDAGDAAKGEWPVRANGEPVASGCKYPWTMVVVRPDQKVIPCCLWSDATIMGDLSTQTFEEIWNGAPYKRLRTELQTDRPRRCCQECPEHKRI
ncbi:MAG: SPASM domain-containing protein [Planctomycetes bacterium]|nr:SPASM domain-containing protein [Planctomycetota bacterium]